MWILSLPVQPDQLAGRRHGSQRNQPGKHDMHRQCPNASGPQLKDRSSREPSEAIPPRGVVDRRLAR